MSKCARPANYARRSFAQARDCSTTDSQGRRGSGRAREGIKILALADAAQADIDKLKEIESIETWMCDDLDEMDIVDMMDRSGKRKEQNIF